jgi:hypothetical protein
MGPRINLASQDPPSPGRNINPGSVSSLVLLLHAGSGNWYSAHELVLLAIAEIAQAAGYSTNRGKRVPNSRFQKRGDLEIKRAAIHGKIVNKTGRNKRAADFY